MAAKHITAAERNNPTVRKGAPNLIQKVLCGQEAGAQVAQAWVDWTADGLCAAWIRNLLQKLPGHIKSSHQNCATALCTNCCNCRCKPSNCWNLAGQILWTWKLVCDVVREERDSPVVLVCVMGVWSVSWGSCSFSICSASRMLRHSCIWIVLHIACSRSALSCSLIVVLRFANLGLSSRLCDSAAHILFRFTTIHSCICKHSPVEILHRHPSALFALVQSKGVRMLEHGQLIQIRGMSTTPIVICQLTHMEGIPAAHGCLLSLCQELQKQRFL